MSKNIVMQEFTNTRYETLYPKTSTSQLEGDISVISGYSKAWNVGDILVTSRTNLGQKWLLCNGIQIKANEYSELKDYLFASSPKTNWQEDGVFDTTVYTTSINNGGYTAQIGRNLYFFTNGSSERDLVAYVINMDSQEKREIHFSTTVDFFVVSVWKDEETNIVYLLSSKDQTSYFIKFENEQFSYIGSYYNRYWKVAVNTQIFKKGNVFYLFDSRTRTTHVASYYVSTTDFLSFNYYNVSVLYQNGAYMFRPLKIQNGLLYAYATIDDNFYYKVFAEVPIVNFQFNQSEWTSCSQLNYYNSLKGAGSAFGLGVNDDGYWFLFTDKDGVLQKGHSNDFLNWEKVAAITNSCGEYFINMDQSSLYVLDTIKDSLPTPIVFQGERVAGVAFDNVTSMYFLFSMITNSQQVKKYQSFNSLLLPNLNISSSNQSSIYTYIKAKD